MAKEPTRTEQQRGTRKLVMWTAAAAGVVFVVLLVLSVLGVLSW